MTTEQLTLPHAHRFRLEPPHPGQTRSMGTCSTCGETRDCGATFELGDEFRHYRERGGEVMRRRHGG